MDSSAPGSVYPRSTTTLTLHERFSQVQVDQLARSRTGTFDPVPLQQPKGCGPPQVFMKRERSSLLHQQTRYLSLEVKQHFRRKSVWTRLGGQQETRLLSTCRPPGFWSFMNKYRRRTSFTSTYRGRTHLQRGGAGASRGRGFSKDQVPTKEHLDAQLDEYMSMSKSRLDAQLDEYMSMAGQTHWGLGV